MARINTRIPVIALDYINERHKAVEKELLVDYDNGNIYVVSKDDKSIIIDITSKIKEQLESMTGDKIEITIEGIGTVNLTEVIKKLQLDMQNSVQVVPTGEDIHYVGRENVLDEKSLEVVNKRIQLKGFSSAETHMIPRKGTNGELEWINMLLVPEDGSNKPGNGGSGDIIPPGNPDDAQSLSVTILEPVNDKIYLRASRRQKSINVSKNCIVVIPRVLDQFCEIEWYVVTNDFVPLFRFSNNVLWADVTDTQPKANSHHVYKFKSWDAGETWIGEIVHYNKVASESTGTIDIEYLKENYLDKNQIASDYYNKTEINDKIDAINTIDPSNYYNKQEIHDRYYDKEQVIIKLEELDVEVDRKFTSMNQNISSEIQGVIDRIPDVSNKVEREELDNYYNKGEIDTKFEELVIPDGDLTVDLTDYVKHEYLGENYHNKTVIEEKITEVRNEIPDVSTKIERQELDNYYNKGEIDTKFDNIPQANLDDYVQQTELESNYYNKGEIDTKLGDLDIPNLDDYVQQTDLESNYYNKGEIDNKFDDLVIPEGGGVTDLSNYYNKQEMEEKYYDKEQVEGRINEINAVDPANYYNKEQVDSKLEQEYYDKNHIDSEHYNRQEVDGLISWKEGASFQNKLPKYRR